MNKEDVKKGYLAAMATMEVEPEYAEQYWESYESSQYWINNKSKLKNIGVIGDVIKRSVIEINYDGHLKAQIETTDLQPKVLKAVNGYGQPVDVKGVIISDPID